MFSMINKDHVTGAVFGVAILAALSFVTGCSDACDEDTAVVESTTTTTEETTEETTEGETKTPTDDTGSDSGSDTGTTTSAGS